MILNLLLLLLPHISLAFMCYSCASKPFQWSKKFVGCNECSSYLQSCAKINGKRTNLPESSISYVHGNG